MESSRSPWYICDGIDCLNHRLACSNVCDSRRAHDKDNGHRGWNNSVRPRCTLCLLQIVEEDQCFDQTKNDGAPLCSPWLDLAVDPNLKGRPRALEKMRNDYNGDARYLKDLLRLTCVAKSCGRMIEAFKGLPTEGFKIWQVSTIRMYVIQYKVRI